jgi:citrate synthase
MDVDMILHAEHGSNASAFAARVVAARTRTCTRP